MRCPSVPENQMSWSLSIYASSQWRRSRNHEQIGELFPSLTTMQQPEPRKKPRATSKVVPSPKTTSIFSRGTSSQQAFSKNYSPCGGKPGILVRKRKVGNLRVLNQDLYESKGFGDWLTDSPSRTSEVTFCRSDRFCPAATNSLQGLVGLITIKAVSLPVPASTIFM